jgi:formylglycine-generating enzyme required for sulfatase activity
MFLSFSCSREKPTPYNVSDHAIKDTVINNIDLVYVPKGEYLKGIDYETDTLNYNYWIGKYEITNLQFYNFIEEALESGFIFFENHILYYYYKGDEIVPEGKYRVKIFDDRIFVKNDSVILNKTHANHPVISVTWYGVKAFCDFYDFSIPSEAEWEKAARGSQKWRFPWGNNIDSSYANYYNSKDPFEPGTTPVGFYNGENHNAFQTSNAVSFYGCYDMGGNAWEWINCYWSSDIPFHKGKGAGFTYHYPVFLQVYYTSTFGPQDRPKNLDMCDLPDGFRVVYKNK